MRERYAGHQGYKFLDEKGQLVPEKVYYRYHSFVNVIRQAEEKRKNEGIFRGDKKRRPFIAVITNK